MKVRLRHWWEVITSGYWFVPSAMTVLAAVLAFAMLYIDRHFVGADQRIAWLYSGGADGAKTLLSTVAGSVITVAGVVFSITIAALTQAAAQFGPRLLRNFMRDTANQVVLGTFVATFLYCLLVLRTIHGEVGDGAAFVPQASVTVAVMLATASITLLIYFIHHVSMSLQAPNVVAAVRRECFRVLDDLARDRAKAGDALPQRGGGLPAAPRATGATDEGVDADADTDAASLAGELQEAGGRSVPSESDGYVQAVDYEALIDHACRADLVLQLACRPGDYVIAGSPLLHAWPAARCGTKFERLVCESFILGDHATAEQDAEYAIRQMVEVAVRALSPGINDPFTAINCIDALGSAVCRISRTNLPGPRRYDADGRLRLVTPVSTFAGITDAAFDQIRQYGQGSVAVMLRLLEVIGACLEQVTGDERREALLRHAEMVFVQGQRPELIAEPSDRDDIRRRWQAITAATGEAAAGQSADEPHPFGHANARGDVARGNGASGGNQQ